MSRSPIGETVRWRRDVYEVEELELQHYPSTARYNAPFRRSLTKFEHPTLFLATFVFYW
jgi:hypothetical protein